MTGEALKEKNGKVKRAVAYIGPLEGDLFEAHMAAAKNVSLADSFEFYHTSDADVAEHFGLSGSGIVILRNFEEPVLRYTGPKNRTKLVEFIVKYSKPALTNFDQNIMNIV